MTDLTAALDRIAEVWPELAATNALVGFRGRYRHRWQYAMTDDEWTKALMQSIAVAYDELTGRTPRATLSWPADGAALAAGIGAAHKPLTEKAEIDRAAAVWRCPTHGAPILTDVNGRDVVCHHCGEVCQQEPPWVPDGWSQVPPRPTPGYE